MWDIMLSWPGFWIYVLTVAGLIVYALWTRDVPGPAYVDSVLLSSYRARQEEGEAPDPIRGTIQRVDYRRRELRVIAGGQVWEFAVPADCRLWFNDTPAVLRCFHPLDPVTVLYQDQGAGRTAEVVYSWEPESAPWELDDA